MAQDEAKWPRQYAREYIDRKLAGDREGARRALEDVPERMQGLVRDHINIAMEKMAIAQRKRTGGKDDGRL